MHKQPPPFFLPPPNVALYKSLVVSPDDKPTFATIGGGMKKGEYGEILSINKGVDDDGEQHGKNKKSNEQPPRIVLPPPNGTPCRNVPTSHNDKSARVANSGGGMMAAYGEYRSVAVGSGEEFF